MPLDENAHRKGRPQIILVTSCGASAASSTSSTSTASVSPAPLSICSASISFNGTSLLPVDGSGNPVQVITLDQTFQVLCNTNFPGGSAYGNPGVHDIMKMYQQDTIRCVAVCAEYNGRVPEKCGWGDRSRRRTMQGCQFGSRSGRVLLSQE